MKKEVKEEDLKKVEVMVEPHSILEEAPGLGMVVDVDAEKVEQVSDQDKDEQESDQGKKKESPPEKKEKPKKKRKREPSLSRACQKRKRQSDCARQTRFLDLSFNEVVQVFFCNQ